MSLKRTLDASTNLSTPTAKARQFPKTAPSMMPLDNNIVHLSESPIEFSEATSTNPFFPVEFLSPPTYNHVSSYTSSSLTTPVPSSFVPAPVPPPVSVREPKQMDAATRLAEERAARNREGSRRAREKAKARARTQESQLVGALEANRRQAAAMESMTAEIHRLQDVLSMCICRQGRC